MSMSAFQKATCVNTAPRGFSLSQNGSGCLTLGRARCIPGRPPSLVLSLGPACSLWDWRLWDLLDPNPTLGAEGQGCF